MMKLLLLVVALSVASLSHAQVSCRKLFLENTVAFEPRLLNVSGHFRFSAVEFDGTLSEATSRPEVQRLISAHQGELYKIIGSMDIAPELGGGKLRLVTLNIGHYNLAYNHQELVALLRVNPALAHRLGMFAIPEYEHVVWIPDEVQLNHRLKLIAQEHGINDALWGYGAANGVVQFEPYIELLKNGKFPFSNDSEVNLAVHDAMHSVAFAALNSTKSSREVMKYALARAQSIARIYSVIEVEFPELKNQFQAQAMAIVPDAMERTMLLTILMTGNSGYFSPNLSRADNKYFSEKNKEMTLESIRTLLTLFTRGTTNFKSVHDALASSVSEEKKARLKEIFQKEINASLAPSKVLIHAAARDLVDFFFPSKIFSNAAAVTEKHKAIEAKSEAIYSVKPGPKEENIN